MTPFQQRQLGLMRQMELRFASSTHTATIVPFQSNYATDNQLCLSLNTFISTEITALIQSKLIDPLKFIDTSQYYYPSGSLHITFHSIRIIHDPPSYTEKDIEVSKQLLSRIIPLEHQFPFILQGVLSMPTSVSVIALITPEYDRFIRRLRLTFTNAGIPDDKKYFTRNSVFANTTFCRYTHKPSLDFLKKIETLKDISIGTFIAKDVSLVETNAGAHPSKTRILETYRFTSK